MMEVQGVGMDRYSYDPLPKGPSIRTLQIHPGEPHEDVVVTLTCVRFDNDAPPYYEALSYVWGSTENPKFIEVVTNEGSNTAKLAVSQNLALALHHLRPLPGSSPRTMWIDAICINQQDNVEKGSQVAQMGNIYTKASRVTIWLGPEHDGSDGAMECMRLIGSQVSIDYHEDRMSSVPGAADPTLSDLRVNIPLEEHKWGPILQLLSCEWFERLWVRQEVYLARSPMILYGKSELEWSLFRAALYCISFKSKNISYDVGRKLAERLEVLTELRNQDTVSVHQMRERFSYVHCFDPRDRVFAVQSMVSPDVLTFWPVPDYTRPAIEIYKEVVVGHLKKFSDGLEILSQCELHDEPTKLGDNLVPSWVPDWSVPTGFGRKWQGGGCRIGDWWELPGDSNPGLLRVLGRRMDVIQSVEMAPYWLKDPKLSQHPEEAIHVYRSVLPDIQPGELYPHGGTMIQAYAHTLVYGHVAERRCNKTGGWPTSEAISDVVEKILQGHKFNSTTDMRVGANLFHSLNGLAKFKNKRIIRGAQGYLGMAPPPVKVGDEIWAIVGSSMPMLLRKTDEGRFRVVSECYAKGLVDAEGLLGPLPQGIQGTWAPNDKGQWGRGFLETETGKTFLRDPRMDALGLLDGKTDEKINNRSISFKYGPETPGSERLLKVIPGLKKIELV